MSSKVGKVMGSEEIVFMTRALQLAAKGHKLPPEAKKQLAELGQATRALDAALASTAKAAPQARIDCREEERVVHAKARALDLLLEAFASAGNEDAQAARDAIFPEGRAYARLRGSLKQAAIKAVLARAHDWSALLKDLGGQSFVSELEEAQEVYVAKLLASAAQPQPKPVRIAELHAAAREALRRYVAIVSAYATLTNDGMDEELLAPLAHRSASTKKAAPADAETGPTEEPAPPSVAA